MKQTMRRPLAPLKQVKTSYTEDAPTREVEQMCLRLNSALSTEIDEFIASLTGGEIGFMPRRTDVVRYLISRGLQTARGARK